MPRTAGARGKSVADDAIDGFDIVISSAGGAVSAEWAPKFAERGLPGVKVNLPSFTEKDRGDATVGLEGQDDPVPERQRGRVDVAERHVARAERAEHSARRVAPFEPEAGAYGGHSHGVRAST